MLARLSLLSFFLPLTRAGQEDPSLSLGSGATPATPPVQILAPQPGNTNATNIAGDLFGSSFSLSGNLLAVGSPLHNDNDGAVFVYRLSQEDEELGWMLDDMLTLPLENQEMVNLGVEITRGARFGWMVNLHEDTLVVTSRVLYRVDVFKLQTGKWTHMQTIEAPQEDALFGDELALIDTHLAIKRSDVLEVYLFSASGLFVHLQSIAASDWHDEGSDPLMGTFAIQSNVLAIAVEDNSQRTVAKSKGSVRVYVLDDADYFQHQHRLVLPDGLPGDRFGKYIALQGEHLVVSTTQEREQIAVFHPCNPEPTAILPLAGSVTMHNGILAMRRNSNVVTLLTQKNTRDSSSPWEGLVDWTLTDFFWFAPNIAMQEETLVLSDPLSPNADTGANTGAVYLFDMGDDDALAATLANRRSSFTVATCPTAQRPFFFECGTSSIRFSLIILTSVSLVAFVALTTYCLCCRRKSATVLTAIPVHSDEEPPAKLSSDDLTEETIS